MRNLYVYVRNAYEIVMQSWQFSQPFHVCLRMFNKNFTHKQLYTLQMNYSAYTFKKYTHYVCITYKKQMKYVRFTLESLGGETIQ